MEVAHIPIRSVRRCLESLAKPERLGNPMTIRLIRSTILFAVLGASLVLSAPARASFNLGTAANYGVIAGPNTTSMQFSNSTFNGNVATDNSTTTAGGNYVQFSSGTINGNFSFVGTAQTNLGSGTLNGSKIANDANVATAYTTITNLSTQFAAESGTSFGSGAQTLLATNGILDSSGNHVFQTTASNFLQGGTLTINGSSSQYVVVDVTGNSNVQLSNQLLLTGGITDDHVFINVVGSGDQVGGTTNGGAINGVFVALNDSFNIDNTTIDGRVIGGSNQNFMLVSGIVLTAPPSPVPEPASLALFSGGLIGIGMIRRRKGVQ